MTDPARGRDAVESDVEGLAELSGRAFADDPLMRWLFPRADGRAGVVARMNGILLRRVLRPAGGQIRMSDDASGFVAWTGPGTDRALALRSLMAAPRLLMQMGPAPFVRFLRCQKAGMRKHPRTDQLFVQLIAVEPDRQRSGIGSALMAVVIAQANERGLPVVLWTQNPENIPFYARLGFAVVDQVPGQKGSPPQWLMRRD